MQRSLLSLQGVLYSFTPPFIFCVCAFLAPLLSAQHLTDTEADRLVAGEMAVIEAKKTSKRQYTVLETHSRVNGSGGMIFHEVVPPVLKASASVQKSSGEISAEALGSAKFQNVRERRSLSLSIKVYDGEMSELIWHLNGRIIRAFSNIDFAYLTAMCEFEGEGVVYSLFALKTLTTRDWELEKRKAMQHAGLEVQNYTIPKISEFSGSEAEYLVYPDSTEPISGEVYNALDALHLYYIEHEAQLRAAAQKSASLAEARKRYEEAHPKSEEPTVIYYWKAEDSKGGNRR